MRHLALISVLTVLLAGCGATGSTASAPAPTAVPTVMPTPPATPTPTPVVTPAATATPKPSPKIVAGWPKVRQGGVTMTGRTVAAGDWEGGPSGPVIRVKVTGLGPSEVVSLSGTGTYDGALLCGPRPSGCGGDTTPDCLPTYGTEVKGRVTVTKQASADDSGTAFATLRFTIPEPQEACPVAGGEPGWLQLPNSWRVRVTDEAHGLRLAPKRYDYGP